MEIIDIELQHRKIKYTCECGTVSLLYQKTRHEQSLKHQKYVLGFIFKNDTKNDYVIEPSYIVKPDRYSLKHKCLCGGVYTNVNKNQHLESIKHIKFTKNSYSSMICFDKHVFVVPQLEQQALRLQF